MCVARYKHGKGRQRQKKRSSMPGEEKVPAKVDRLDVDPSNHRLQDHNNVAQYKHAEGHQRQKKQSSMPGEEKMHAKVSLQHYNVAQYEHDEVRQKKIAADRRRPSITQDVNIPGHKSECLDVDPRTQSLLYHKVALYNEYSEGHQKGTKQSPMPEVEKMPAQNREPNESDADQMQPSCAHIVHQKHDKGLVKASGPWAVNQKMPAKEREQFKSYADQTQPSYTYIVKQNYGDGGAKMSVPSAADQMMPEHTSKHVTSDVDNHLQPSQDLAIQQKHDESHQKKKKSPSIIIHLDKRGPIPPTSDDFLGSSITLLVEELAFVSLGEEESLVVDEPHQE